MAKSSKRSAKKPAARKSAGKPAAVKISPASKPRSKGEVYGTIAEACNLSRKEVAGIFDTMAMMIGADLSKRGPGVFQVPGMMKVVVQRKPAQPARKGINPFTGEETTFKAKPARNVVKVRAMKKLKDLVA